MKEKISERFVMNTNQMLGKGSFGFVYSGTNTQTGEKVAIKSIFKKKIDSNAYLTAAFKQEIKLLKTLKSQNIVVLYDALEDSHNYYIVQQRCDKDLQSLLASKKNFSQKESIDLLFQISSGFISLVREGIIHRDIKPANILIKNDVLKIADFGCSKMIANLNKQNNSFVGTPQYMSPQILKGQQYTSKADIWSIGVLFYHILHGEVPFSGQSQLQILKKIQEGEIKFRQDISDKTKDFIIQCLKSEQTDRIDWDRYFMHPIFAGRFKTYANQKNEFQDKRKMMALKLRFQIYSQNLDISKIFKTLHNPQKQLGFDQFQELLKKLSVDISRQEAVYIFGETDTNNNGKITLSQIQNQMINHSIPFKQMFGLFSKHITQKLQKKFHNLIQGTKNGFNVQIKPQQLQGSFSFLDINKKESIQSTNDRHDNSEVTEIGYKQQQSETIDQSFYKSKIFQGEQESSIQRYDKQSQFAIYESQKQKNTNSFESFLQKGEIYKVQSPINRY